EAVCGRSADGARPLRRQQRDPRDVAVSLAGVVAGADDDVLALVGIDPGAADEFLDYVGRRIIGPHIPQDAIVAAHRRANGVDDYGIAELRGHGRIMDIGSWILDALAYCISYPIHRLKSRLPFSAIQDPASKIQDRHSPLKFACR